MAVFSSLFLPQAPLFLPSLGVGELALVLIIVLLLFGPGKLPMVAKALGESLHAFKAAAAEPPSPTALPPSAAQPPSDEPDDSPAS